MTLATIRHLPDLYPASKYQKPTKNKKLSNKYSRYEENDDDSLSSISSFNLSDIEAADLKDASFRERMNPNHNNLNPPDDTSEDELLLFPCDLENTRPHHK